MNGLVLLYNAIQDLKFSIKHFEITDHANAALAFCYLGWDSVIGNNFTTVVKSLKISVLPKENTALTEFYNDDIILKKVRKLSDWRLPLTLTCIFEKSIPEAIFTLNGNMMANRLGHLYKAQNNINDVLGS